MSSNLIEQLIRQQIGAAQYESWFRTAKYQLVHTTLTIEVASRFLSRWIESNYLSQIASALNGHVLVQYIKVSDRSLAVTARPAITLVPATLDKEKTKANWCTNPDFPNAWIDKLWVMGPPGCGLSHYANALAISTNSPLIDGKTISAAVAKADVVEWTKLAASTRLIITDLHALSKDAWPIVLLIVRRMLDDRKPVAVFGRITKAIHPRWLELWSKAPLIIPPPSIHFRLALASFWSVRSNKRFTAEQLASLGDLPNLNDLHKAWSRLSKPRAQAIRASISSKPSDAAALALIRAKETRMQELLPARAAITKAMYAVRSAVRSKLPSADTLRKSLTAFMYLALGGDRSQLVAIWNVSPTRLFKMEESAARYLIRIGNDNPVYVSIVQRMGLNHDQQQKIVAATNRIQERIQRRANSKQSTVAKSAMDALQTSVG